MEPAPPGAPGEAVGPRLVLASGSPRRRELLSGLGLSFAVRPADVDESVLPGESPEVYVERLARTKAEHEAHPGEVVLAADTTVAVPVEAGEEILGKPADEAEARAMLARLCDGAHGRHHRVLTGVAVHDPTRGETRSSVEATGVVFTAMSPQEIAWYAASGEPLDKAGAYGIQGFGGLFVEGVEGNYSNVVGLPLPLTWRLLTGAGFSLGALGPGSAHGK